MPRTVRGETVLADPPTARTLGTGALQELGSMLKVPFTAGYAENAALGRGHLGPGLHVLARPFAMHALACRIGELIATPRRRDRHLPSTSAAPASAEAGKASRRSPFGSLLGDW